MEQYMQEYFAEKKLSSKTVEREKRNHTRMRKCVLDFSSSEIINI